MARAHGAARSGLDGRRIEDRIAKRSSRRLMVRFGAHAPDRTGFTQNISVTGLFLKTNSVLPPGTTVAIEIHFPQGTFSQWARVAWAKKVPPQLAHVLECGMGLHYVDPTEAWRTFFEQWKKKGGID